MTRKEKRKYKRDLSKTTELSLIKEYIRLNKGTMGSVAERMADMGYPPDMCEEQSENEEDDLWCLNAIEKEFKKRDKRVNVIGTIEEWTMDRRVRFYETVKNLTDVNLVNYLSKFTNDFLDIASGDFEWGREVIIDEIRLRGILQETTNCPELDIQGDL
jgi:hypothetical protein